MSFDDIPEEMRSLPNWVVVMDATNKIPFDPKNCTRKASTIDPETWASFDVAKQRLNGVFKFLGFVFTKQAGITGIDLDDKLSKPATPEQKARHEKIRDTFKSYTERSVSGRGHHIYVKGAVPEGVRKDNVEVYSDKWFFIVTGDTVRKAPLADCQSLLDNMFKQMKPHGASTPMAPQEDRDAIQTDEELLEMANNAANSEKFKTLWNGEWQRMEIYPSQSEADQALLGMLCFYSPSNTQVKQLFRNSELGKREKATKDDKYLDRTIAKIRRNEPPPVDATALLERAARVGGSHPPSTSERPVTQTTANAPIVFPPGLVGDLASYFYSSAIRPVPEVALASAIGFTAGFAGRQWNTAGQAAGLNFYVVLLAKTGRGKEGAKKAAMRIVYRILRSFSGLPTVPTIMDFIGPSYFASGQGLLKHLDVGSRCFVSFLGEVGQTLSKVTSASANASDKEFKTQLLNLYSLSGKDGYVGVKAHADTEKNSKSVRAPSFSFVGDSTPETFYECLDDSRLADGLIPRLLVIEYTGLRPPENPYAGHPPPDTLVEAVKSLAIQSLTLASRDGDEFFIQVPLSPEAMVVLHQFRDEADSLINNAGSFNVQAEAWNRAYENSLKLATLVAVGANLYNPKVTEEHARWAIALVRRSVGSILGRFQDGEVGGGDGTKAEALIKRAVLKYLAMTPEERANDPKIPKGMHTHEPFIPYAYLSDQVRRLAPFKDKDWLLRSKLEDLVKSGVLTKVADRGILTRLKVRDGEVYTLGENCDWRSQ